MSSEFDRCEVAYRPRKPINLARARKQHEAYATALREVGATVEFIRPPAEDLGAVFVGSSAVLLPEVIVMGRTAAEPRLDAIEAVARVLAQYRPVQRIAFDGKLDGGDVLRVGRTLFVAESRQTDAEGIAGLREIVGAFGYDVRPLEVRDSRRLNTAASFVPPRFLIVNSDLVSPTAFGNLLAVAVHDTEPFAANTLTIAGTTLVSASFPKTESRLRDAGITIRSVDISEFEKADAGLTCLGLLMEEKGEKAPTSGLGLKPIEVAEAPRPTGHWSQAVVHGGLIYVSAQLPFGATAGRQRMSAEEQVEQSLRNIAAVLASAGSSLSRVVRATVYLADPKHLEKIEPVYARLFQGHRPARAVIANPALPPGVLVAIEVVAAVGEEPG